MFVLSYNLPLGWQVGGGVGGWRGWVLALYEQNKEYFYDIMADRSTKTVKHHESLKSGQVIQFVIIHSYIIYID